MTRSEEFQRRSSIHFTRLRVRALPTSCQLDMLLFIADADDYKSILERLRKHAPCAKAERERLN